MELYSQSPRDNLGFIREQQQLFSKEFLVTLSVPKAILTAAFFHFDVVPLCQTVHFHLAFSLLSTKQALVAPCRSTSFHVSSMSSPCLFLLTWVSEGNFRFSCRGFWLLPWVAPILMRTTFEFRWVSSARRLSTLIVSTQVTNIKKTLKATASSSAQEMEQQLAERECPPHTEQRQPTKKMSKVKGLVSSRH